MVKRPMPEAQITSSGDLVVHLGDRIEKVPKAHRTEQANSRGCLMKYVCS